jgi:Rps23 Pro-64 3,4-dihydroxylase Tpa1-like proline 4-hydroxylase
MENIINVNKFMEQLVDFQHRVPFPHLVVDNFFTEQIANQLAEDFPNSDSSVFNGNYNNQIEIKNTCNIWDRFPPTTYKVLCYLNSSEFIGIIEHHTGIKLYSDPGLHGGGWHLHPPGGKLNVHLDYTLHPKTELMRRYNLIVYLNPNYKSGWGGELGLWTHDETMNQPKKCVKVIEPKFNRAILFDTTVNSWHGLEIPNKFPDKECRKSLAVYYLTLPNVQMDSRKRALFAPNEEQRNDTEVLDLIERRSKVTGEDPTKWARI